MLQSRNVGITNSVLKELWPLLLIVQMERQTCKPGGEHRQREGSCMPDDTWNTTGVVVQSETLWNLTFFISFFQPTSSPTLLHIVVIIITNAALVGSVCHTTLAVSQSRVCILPIISWLRHRHSPDVTTSPMDNSIK